MALLFQGQLSDSEKSDFHAAVERLRLLWLTRKPDEVFPTFEEATRGVTTQPRDESRHYLRYLDHVLDRLELRGAYREALRNRCDFPTVFEFPDNLCELGRPMFDHVNAVNDALIEVMNR